MSNIKKLQQQRADLVGEASAIADKRANKVKLTEEETARFAAIKTELTEVNAAIADEEALQNERRSMDAVRPANEDTAREAGDRRDGQKRTETPKFTTFGEQLQAIVRSSQPGAQKDPRLSYDAAAFNASPTGMNESVGADGGFLVQTDFQTELLQNVWQNGDILARIRKIGVGPNSNGVSFNGVDETSRANGSRWGGIQTYWTAEAGLKTASQPQFRKVKLDLEKLAGLCYATDELLQDSTALESWLRQVFQDEMTFKIEDAIINGTGAGQPLGILNSGAVISVAKETSQLAATITAANIFAMWIRMPPRNRSNAVWLVNSDTEGQLANLYTPIKNVAGTDNVGGIASVAVNYTPVGMGGARFATLMGRPVIPVEYAATLGTVGDIILVDLGQYLGIDKGGMQTASSIHVRFIYDETTFRFVYRFNGMPLWRTTMTPYKGSNTQSPFVVLATRA